jgi:DNA-binding transcriptional ArsR family regulator
MSVAVMSAAAGRGYQLQAGPPEGLALSIVMFPQQSVVALLRRMAGGHRQDGPAGLPALAERALCPGARYAVQSLSPSWPPVIPECCAPIPPLSDTPVPEQVTRLHDLPPDVLTSELQATDAGHRFPPPWRAVADQPGRWLASMADASADAWGAMAPQWKAAAPLLDREVDRVGTAVVRGGVEALLNSLHPRISYVSGELAVAFPHDRRVALGGRRLVLVPMIARRDELAVSFERPEVCYVCYPIRSPGPGRQAADDADALALILGPLRAAALLTLRQPLTVGEVAAALQCAPATATYHLQHLAAAGLITRERHGTSVRISRTIRGEAMIDLLSE